MKLVDALSVIGLAAGTAAIYTITVGDKVKNFADKQINKWKHHE